MAIAMPRSRMLPFSRCRAATYYGVESSRKMFWRRQRRFPLQGPWSRFDGHARSPRIYAAVDRNVPSSAASDMRTTAARYVPTQPVKASRRAHGFAERLLLPEDADAGDTRSGRMGYGLSCSLR